MKYQVGQRVRAFGHFWKICGVSTHARQVYAVCLVRQEVVNGKPEDVELVCRKPQFKEIKVVEND